MRLDLGDADFRATLVGWLRELSDEVIIDLNLVFDQFPGCTQLHCLSCGIESCNSAA